MLQQWMCNPAETVQLVHGKIYELDFVFMTICLGEESNFKLSCLAELKQTTVEKRWHYVNIVLFFPPKLPDNKYYDHSMTKILLHNEMSTAVGFMQSPLNHSAYMRKEEHLLRKV